MSTKPKIRSMHESVLWLPCLVAFWSRSSGFGTLERDWSDLDLYVAS
jgi:hypothetical protein